MFWQKGENSLRKYLGYRNFVTAYTSKVSLSLYSPGTKLIVVPSRSVPSASGPSHQLARRVKYFDPRASHRAGAQTRQRQRRTGRGVTDYTR